MREEARGPAFLLHLALSVAVLLFLCHPESAGGADFTIETIQKAYENIKDIKGSFVQKSTIKDLKRTDTFSGTFMIKVPSKMRWQYQGAGKETEVIISNAEMTIYQKSEKQVLKGRFDKEGYGQAPLALLGGFGSIEKEFDVAAREGRLLLTPKRSMGSVSSVELIASEGEFPINSLIITDKRSNRIEITFRKVSLNSGIKDSAFNFSAPEGVSVFENQSR